MSEVETKKNTRKETVKITLDEETKEMLGGYAVFTQIIKQIEFRLGEKSKWYIENYRAKKDDNGITTFSAEVIVEEAKQ